MKRILILSAVLAALGVAPAGLLCVGMLALGARARRTRS